MSCLSVCLSVRYTSGASFRPENAVTYSAGNEGQNICGVFSETAPLQRSSIPSNDGNTYRRPFFVRKARMRIIVNPRRACAARVTVCVCLLSHISPIERLFVLKTLSRTQRATKVKKFVGFSLKPHRCRDPALPPLYGHAYSRPFFLYSMRICSACVFLVYAHDTPPRVQHFSAFHWVCVCVC